MEEEAARQEQAREGAAKAAAAALVRLREQHAAEWLEAKDAEARAQEAHSQREDALTAALAQADGARGALLETLRACMPPLEEVARDMVASGEDVRAVRQGVELQEGALVDSKEHVQKTVLHAATAIDEQRSAHEQALADMKDEMRRKEQRVMEQWQELSRKTDEKVVNTQERICQLEVQLADERKQFEQMLADKDTSLRSMLADVQEHRRLLADAGKMKEMRERAHETRNAFKDWQVRRASAIMTVLAHKGGKASLPSMPARGVVPGAPGGQVPRKMMHVPFTISNDREPAPEMRGESVKSAPRSASPLAASWQVTDDSRRDNSLEKEREWGGLSTRKADPTTGSNALPSDIQQVIPPTPSAAHQPLTPSQKAPFPDDSTSPMRVPSEGERALGRGGARGGQDEEEAAMFAQYRARRSKEMMGVFVGISVCECVCVRAFARACCVSVLRGGNLSVVQMRACSTLLLAPLFVFHGGTIAHQDCTELCLRRREATFAFCSLTHSHTLSPSLTQMHRRLGHTACVTNDKGHRQGPSYGNCGDGACARREI